MWVSLSQSHDEKPWFYRKRNRNNCEVFRVYAFRAITVCSILGVRRSVRTERLLVGLKEKNQKKKKTKHTLHDTDTLKTCTQRYTHVYRETTELVVN